MEDERFWQRLDPIDMVDENKQAEVSFKIGDTVWKLGEEEALTTASTDQMSETESEAKYLLGQSKELTSESFRRKLKMLLQEFEEVFKEELDSETEAVATEMKIEIKEGESLPKPQKMRRRSQTEEKTIEEC